MKLWQWQEEGGSTTPQIEQSGSPLWRQYVYKGYFYYKVVFIYLICTYTASSGAMISEQLGHMISLILHIFRPHRLLISWATYLME